MSVQISPNLGGLNLVKLFLLKDCRFSLNERKIDGCKTCVVWWWYYVRPHFNINNLKLLLSLKFASKIWCYLCQKKLINWRICLETKENKDKRWNESESEKETWLCHWKTNFISGASLLSLISLPRTLSCSSFEIIRKRYIGGDTNTT